MKKLILTISVILTCAAGQAMATTLQSRAYVPTPSLRAEGVVYLLRNININDSCTDNGEYALTSLYQPVVCVGGFWERPAGVWTEDGFNIYLTRPDRTDMFVGIGTDAPLTKLHMITDGSFLVEGQYASGDDLVALSGGARMVFYPKKAAFRAGYVGGTEWDHNNMGDYSVAFGNSNWAGGFYSGALAGNGNQSLGTASMVAGGNTNFADQPYSFLGGGLNNRIQDLSPSFYESSVLVGGENNTAKANHGFIGGGFGNTINTGSQESVINGGRTNTVLINSPSNVIGGGQDNEAGGGWSVIGGGNLNKIYGSILGGGATIAGGSRNVINAGPSAGTTIGGGTNNTARQNDATIGGGGGNNVDSAWSTISGGSDNTITGSHGNYHTIAGGAQNTAESDPVVTEGYTAIGGGRNNSTSGNYATIGGGRANTASGEYSVVAGGGGNAAGNTASGDYSVITGGTDNTASGDYSVADGGESNDAQGDHSWTGGQRAVATGDRTFVWGHDNATDVAVTESDRFIVATGIMGVGTTNAHDAYLATFNGDVLIDGKLTVSGDVEANTVPPIESDRELKDNIAPLTGSLEKIKHIDGVSYTWKKDGAEGQRETGIIAQDVETVFPDMVTVNYRGNKAVYYHRLVAPLIEAVKELADQNKALQNSVDQLKEQIRTQQAEITELKM